MSTSNIVNALGAGSGIDIKSLAENLVDVERAPRKQRIDKQISQTEARISGYSAIKFALSSLKSAFEKLNDASDFASLKVGNSQSSAFSVMAGTTAAAGSYSIDVRQVAQGQRTASTVFAERSTPLNGGSPFSLQLQVGSGAVQNIAVNTATPAGIVVAINNAKLGVTAQLINTGSGHQIVITGETGAAKAFTLSTSPTAPASATVVQANEHGVTVQADPLASAVQLQYQDPEDGTRLITVDLEKQLDGSWSLPEGAEPLPSEVEATALAVRPVQSVNLSQPVQPAQDAELWVNGLMVTRPTNSINDILDGVTFDLFTPTTGAARIDLNRDTSAILGNLRDLVSAYNDFEETLKILGDRDSDVEQFGGVLAGESFLQSVRNQVRNFITNPSDTPAGSVSAARHAGLSFDRNGVLQLDEGKLGKALQDNFDEVVQMFSANTNNQSVYSSSPAGLAGRAVRSIDQMLRSTGLVDKQSASAQKRIKEYQGELEKLQDRMDKLLTRYMNQFSAMESIVGNSNSLRTSLKGTFDGMMNAYKR